MSDESVDIGQTKCKEKRLIILLYCIVDDVIWLQSLYTVTLTKDRFYFDFRRTRTDLAQLTTTLNGRSKKQTTFIHSNAFVQ